MGVSFTLKLRVDNDARVLCKVADARQWSGCWWYQGDCVRERTLDDYQATGKVGSERNKC